MEVKVRGQVVFLMEVKVRIRSCWVLTCREELGGNHGISDRTRTVVAGGHRQMNKLLNRCPAVKSTASSVVCLLSSGDYSIHSCAIVIVTLSP